MAESYRPQDSKDQDFKESSRAGDLNFATAFPPIGITMPQPQALRPVVPPRESYFLGADPIRGLKILQQELERLAVLEPRVQDAADRVKERIASLPSEDAEVLMALLWLQ